MKIKNILSLWNLLCDFVGYRLRLPSNGRLRVLLALPQSESDYSPFTFGLAMVLLLLALSGCRKDDPIIPEEVEPLPPQTVTKAEGFYLLNEGNMNMNKASLDYYDYATGVYRRNVYGQANPQATLGLGDVGNDMGVYGSKLYAVINCSNKVEVMDVRTSKRLKVIEIKNCRFVTFAHGKAFVSAYDGEVQLGEVSPNGFVAEIDTTSLTITRTVMVGRQPEELAVVGNKLYVANSGGYSPPNYERIVSVIDLNTFIKIKDIEVADNLYRLKADSYGDLYVSSRGDQYNSPSKLFVIDTKTDAIKKSFTMACSNFTIMGDTAYIIGSESINTANGQKNSYLMIDVKTETLLEKSFIPSSVAGVIKTPYGIAVDPVSKNIFITDATDYVSPGKLHCIDKDGHTVFTVTTGDIPAHFAFAYVTTDIPTDPGDPGEEDGDGDGDGDGEGPEVTIPESEGGFVIDRMKWLHILPQVESTNETTYRWLLHGKEIADTQELLWVFADAGVYNLVFVVTEGEVEVTKTVIVKVNNKIYTNGITRVFAYLPAPGQFTNTIPETTEEDTPETVRQKAEAALAEGSMISLGGFGGYIIFGFDHTVVNREGNDFMVLGNAFVGSAEPGVIMVSYDANQNGLPDDEWFEVAGSEYYKETTIKNYEITYYKPTSEPTNPVEPNYIRWTDNRGQSGYLSKNNFHTQPYYPLWIGNSYTLKGTFMEDNIQDRSGSGVNWVYSAYDWGYADNWANSDPRAQIEIDWAVDSNGHPVKLKGIDFVKVYTGNRAQGGWLGEVSTEIIGFADLNL